MGGKRCQNLGAPSRLDLLAVGCSMREGGGQPPGLGLGGVRRALPSAGAGKVLGGTGFLERSGVCWDVSSSTSHHPPELTVPSSHWSGIGFWKRQVHCPSGSLCWQCPWPAAPGSVSAVGAARTLGTFFLQACHVLSCGKRAPAPSQPRKLVAFSGVCSVYHDPYVFAGLFICLSASLLAP